MNKDIILFTLIVASLAMMGVVIYQNITIDQKVTSFLEGDYEFYITE